MFFDRRLGGPVVTYVLITGLVALGCEVPTFAGERETSAAEGGSSDASATGGTVFGMTRFISFAVAERSSRHWTSRRIESSAAQQAQSGQSDQVSGGTPAYNWNNLLIPGSLLAVIG